MKYLIRLLTYTGRLKVRDNTLSGGIRFLTVFLMAIVLGGCATSNAVKIQNQVKSEEQVARAREIQIQKPPDYFKVGERLTYDVRWLGARVGEVVSTIKSAETQNGREVYVVELTARTNGFCSKIYRIFDRYVSYIDKEDLTSHKHIAQRSEGKYRKDAVTVFDRQNQKAYFQNAVDNSKKTFDIPPLCRDPISAIYYFRTLDVKLRDKVYYKVVNNEEVYDLYALIKDKKFITIENKKTYESFYIEPYALLKGERYKKGNASIYVSSDGQRLPVLGIIKAPLFTRITVSLASIEYVYE